MTVCAIQVSELLSEVSVKVKWRNEMQDFLKQLEAILMKAKKGLDHEVIMLRFK